MKVAVTGGTGFVGSVIVEELLSRGHEVRVMARTVPGSRFQVPSERDVKSDRVQGPTSRDQGLEHHEEAKGAATYLKGDVTTGEGLDELLAGLDALIHLVGIIREKGTNTFEAAHHRATENVLEAASRNNIDRILHMSALGTRPGAVSNYHKTKWAGEEAVRSSGHAWTIFRPSIIFGPGDEFVNLLAKAMKKTPVFPVMGDGKNLMQPVSVYDVSRAYVESMEKEGTIRKVIELGGPDILTFMDILNTIAQAINKKRKYINIPLAAARPIVRLTDTLGLPVPISSDQLIMLTEDNIVRDTSGMEILGFRFMKFDDGIREYLD